MGITIILLLLAVLTIVFALMGFKIIPQAETMVIERLGKFSRVLPAGINIIWPIVDRARATVWRDGINGSLIYKSAIDLRENVYEFPRQNVITKDNVATEINTIIYFQITDPVKAVYEISNLPDAIEKLTQTTLRNLIGEMDLDETLTSRDNINGKLRNVLDEATIKWGLKVNRVELQDINPPQHIREAMEKQMQAERSKRATILESEGKKAALILESEGLRMSEINKAEGEKQSMILKAEGESQARIKTAQGESEAIEKITQAIANKNGDPINYIIAMKYIDKLGEMVSGKDNKIVYMPYEASGILGSIGGIKEMFEKIK
jgi:regulator of protease activity HflC (stomatin/prohibitin superfamily)